MKRHTSVVVVAVALLGLTSCASGGTASPTATGTGTLSTTSIQTIADYTGSTVSAADPSMSPFVLGYVNQEGGPIGFPAYTTQVEALVKIFNDQLGGIGGHPISLVECKVLSSNEEAQACAQQFAANKDIRAVLSFPIITGGDAFHRIMDPTGIPLIGPIAAGLADAQAPNSFYDTAATLSGTPVISQYLTKNLKSKTVAILGAQGDALSQLSTGQLQQGLQAAGIDAKVSMIDPGAADATAAVIASGAQDADAIVNLVSGGSGCISIAKTLKTLTIVNTPVVALGTCADASVKDALGELPAWNYLTGWPQIGSEPLDDRERSEMAVVNDFFQVLGSSSGDLQFTEPSLQGVLSAVRWINSAGGSSATPQAIAAAARADTGPLFLGPSTITFGGIPTFPAVNGLAERVYSYDAGSWTDAADGWISAPL